MSKLKDKLSASVRQAKAVQQPAKQQAAAKPAPAPAAAKSAAQPAKQQKAEKTKAASANQVPQSGTELFPQRVWPD